MIDRKVLKATAKMRMSQSDPHYLQVILLWVLAAVVVPQVALIFVRMPTESLDQLYELLAGGIDLELALQALQISLPQLVTRNLLQLVLGIYQMLMSFGLTLYSLRLYRGEPCGPAELFTGFSMMGRVLGVELIVLLITIALSIPLLIAIVVLTVIIIMSSSSIELVMGVTVLACLAYAAVLVVVLLRYALARLALADRPELGAMGAIQYGKSLIRGHKGAYFKLSLSFFGWAFLCSLLPSIYLVLSTRGLLLPVPEWLDSLILIVLLLPTYLWLTPYMQTTIAGFYDRLDSQAIPPNYPLL